jgi:methionine-rich copper-binding protein CopC
MMRIPVILILAAGVAASAPPALAHAFLTRASPAVGSTVRAAPAEITLRYTEAVEPAFCTVQVTAAGGERVDGGDLHVDDKEPAVLHVSLKPLAPGTYKVVWRVVSVDTHTTNGDFTFKVAP